MRSNIKIFLLCPVPEDQKPINEYLELKENILFSWTQLPEKEYYKTLFSFPIFLFFFLFLLFFNPIPKNIFHQFLLTGLTTFNLIFFFLIGIYTRIKDIDIRFNSARLFYEEASWYDGQIWEKPFSIIKNDKLISRQKLQPIQNRLLLSIWTTLFFLFLFLILFEFY